MRSSRSSLLALAGLLLLSGCGASPGNDAAPSTSGPTSSSPAPSSATPTATTTAPSASPSEPAPAPSTLATVAPRPGHTGDTLPTDDPTAAEASCTPVTAGQALAAALPRVPQFDEGERWAWDPTTADISGFSDCAQLSWITVGIQGPTGSSPYQILLFHRGEFIGPATERAYGFAPRVQRLDDAAIQVTYRWAGPGETTAGASQTAVSVFRWNELRGAADRAGELPPT